MAALSNASLWIAGVASLGFVIFIQIYGRRPQVGYAEYRRKEARRARETNQFGERAVAEALDDGIWIIDPQNRIIFANTAARKLFGDVTPGQRITNILRAPEIAELVRQGLSGATPEPISFNRDTTPELHLKVYAHGLQPYASDADGARHVMMIFRDETEAERFAVMQGDFLANASHELKTPIASLLGYIETLRGHAKDDPKARDTFLGIMQEQAERMQRLISDLLSLRQIEQQEHIAPTQTANMATALGQAVNSVQPIATKRGVRIETVTPSSADVIGDQDELVQLCLNLIDNAVRMSPRDSTLRVSLSHMQTWRLQAVMPGAHAPKGTRARLIIPPLEPDRPYAVLTIADEGPGFGPDHLPRIGERFYRVTGDRTSREKGTGLGLAIVKHVVMRHRGGLHVTTLTASDAEQSGTVFSVVIPAATKPVTT